MSEKKPRKNISALPWVLIILGALIVLIALGLALHGILAGF